MPRSIGFVHDSTELRRLIAENPDLPIVVACDDEQCIGDGISTYMNEISCSVCEVLDAELRYDDYGFYEIFDNREDAEETIENQLVDELHEAGITVSDEEFESLLSKKIKEYEPYWKKVILIRAYQ